MAKRATFAEVCLRPVQCFILLRQSCVFKFVCARKTPAQHRPMQSCAWNRVFHHSRPNNSKIGSGWKTAFISPMLQVLPENRIRREEPSAADSVQNRQGV